jgi:hypothetical protein
VTVLSASIARWASRLEFCLNIKPGGSTACSGCGASINEKWERIAGERMPCPNVKCDCTRRTTGIQAHLSASSKVEVYEMLRWGSRRIGIWGQDGWELFRKTQSWQRVQRSFDKWGDRYKKEIRDGKTGELIMKVEEPLSGHQGYGNAKWKKK